MDAADFIASIGIVLSCWSLLSLYEQSVSILEANDYTKIPEFHEKNIIQ